MGDEKPQQPPPQYYGPPPGMIPQQQPVAQGQVAGALKTIYPLSNFDRFFKN